CSYAPTGTGSPMWSGTWPVAGPPGAGERPAPEPGPVGVPGWRRPGPAGAGRRRDDPVPAAVGAAVTAAGDGDGRRLPLAAVAAAHVRGAVQQPGPAADDRPGPARLASPPVRRGVPAGAAGVGAGGGPAGDGATGADGAGHGHARHR